ncbi:Methylcrotonyl-CoA carboxylase biotin-containing subunit [hydrothermal vent metagenome]|uniref:Methylcrotonyl-CoA carboxylase biotin-containing subunit n=1 Tax=hydrothermal vent metagenome TaxID=652676 RepID=A0A3B0VPE0_9ZZZZ
MKIKTILIANRGEIACRIIQTCRKLGIKSVAVYAAIESDAKHVQMADSAYLIPADTATAAYLNATEIIKVAVANNVDAIHPGYGFLSESAEFAQSIANAGLIFIGAPITALELMGSKAAAKKTMLSAKVPCVPGYHGDAQGVELLQQQADKIGYPLLIKASRGGGGKGMKIVNQAAEFTEALNSAKREAIKSFGNSHVILEKFITKPKHIEVQVFADSLGNVVHLFERDCSSQRRYQKIIEEAPATCITDATKQAMYQAAIEATRAVDYQGAGTIEFIVQDDEFFFMEMNTRLQVEHRVTEMITGTDLVYWQILVASGEPLPLQQAEIKCTGHAIEARIYAEDSFNGFLPATGLLEDVQFCTGKNIIIDTGIGTGDNISIHFDPMIAKTVCWAKNRKKCIEAVLDNLDNTHIAGVKTNLGFLSALINSNEFSNNMVFTNSLDNGSLAINLPVVSNKIITTLIAQTSNNSASSAWSGNSGWSNSGTYFSSYSWLYNNEKISAKAKIVKHTVEFADGSNIEIDNSAILYVSQNQLQLISKRQRYIFDKIDYQANVTAQNTDDIISPMPGKILEIKVKVGDTVTQEQTLVVMEAMKMELALKAGRDAEVTAILVKPNAVISAGIIIIELQ